MQPGDQLGEKLGGYEVDGRILDDLKEGSAPSGMIVVFLSKTLPMPIIPPVGGFAAIYISPAKSGHPSHASE